MHLSSPSPLDAIRCVRRTSSDEANINERNQRNKRKTQIRRHRWRPSHQEIDPEIDPTPAAIPCRSDLQRHLLPRPFNPIDFPILNSPTQCPTSMDVVTGSKPRPPRTSKHRTTIPKLSTCPNQTLRQHTSSAPPPPPCPPNSSPQYRRRSRCTVTLFPQTTVVRAGTAPATLPQQNAEKCTGALQIPAVRSWSPDCLRIDGRVTRIRDRGSSLFYAAFCITVVRAWVGT